MSLLHPRVIGFSSACVDFGGDHDPLRHKGQLRSPLKSALRCVALLSASFSSAIYAQQTDPPKPVVVQPGAPGKPSKTLPSSTKATLPPRSPADVAFMQGMIMHHSQSIAITALIAS